MEAVALQGSTMETHVMSAAALAVALVFVTIYFALRLKAKDRVVADLEKRLSATASQLEYQAQLEQNLRRLVVDAGERAWAQGIQLLSSRAIVREYRAQIRHLLETGRIAADELTPRIRQDLAD